MKEELTYQSIVHILELRISVMNQELKTLKEIKTFSMEKLGRMAVLERELNYNSMVKEACEKQVPLKPDEDDCCVLCHTYLKDDHDDNSGEGDYCPNCGRKADWSAAK